MKKHESAALGLDRCQFCKAVACQPCITPSYMTRAPHAGRPSLPSSVKSRLGAMLVEEIVDGPTLTERRRTHSKQVSNDE